MAALTGVILFGTWYNHYALPLVAPLAIVIAPLGARRGGLACLLLLFGYALVAGQVLTAMHLRQRGDARMLASATEAVRGQRNCLFVYDGLPALYDASGSCLPTSHPFPDHLKAVNEQAATGVDQLAELRRIMGTRPDRVMVREPAPADERAASRAIVFAALRRDYIETWRYPVVGRDYVIYRRTDRPGAGQVAPFGERPRVPTACERVAAGQGSGADLLHDPQRWLEARLAPSMGSCL